MGKDVSEIDQSNHDYLIHKPGSYMQYTKYGDFYTWYINKKSHYKDHTLNA